MESETQFKLKHLNDYKLLLEEMIKQTSKEVYQMKQKVKEINLILTPANIEAVKELEVVLDQYNIRSV